MFAPLLALALFFLPTDSTHASQPERAAQLFQAIHAYTAPFSAPAEDLQVRTEWVDVSGDGVDDAVVYIESASWCGSGGCTILIFETIVGEDDIAELGAFRPAAEISMMNGPIQVSPNATSGWADLIVEATGGQRVVLQFDGETYPASPSGGIAAHHDVVEGPVLFALAD